MKSKYVVIECGKNEGVIVFSPFLLHQDVAGTYKVKSAGYCELKDNAGWRVSGRSDSLECCPRPQDEEVLNQHLLIKQPLHFVDRPVSR